MKRLLTLALAATLVACGGNESATPEAEGGMPATQTTDTNAQSPQSVPAASATTTGSGSGTVTNLSDDDKTFVVTAGMGGLYELMAGNMALQKASSAAVRTFAQRMVTDHGKANQELQTLATTKGLALPTELGGDHKSAADHLATLSGSEFDKAYMTHMVEDHQKTVADFEKASTSASDNDIKTWATKTLPTLKDHHKQATTIAQGVR